MKSLFSFGHRIGYAIYDAGAAISDPKVAGRVAERILPEEKPQRIIVLETDLRNHALLRLFYLSGGRVTEVADLHWPTYYGSHASYGPYRSHHSRRPYLQEYLRRLATGVLSDLGDFLS